MCIRDRDIGHIVITICIVVFNSGIIKHWRNCVTTLVFSKTAKSLSKYCYTSPRLWDSFTIFLSSVEYNHTADRTWKAADQLKQWRKPTCNILNIPYMYIIQVDVNMGILVQFRSQQNIKENYGRNVDNSMQKNTQ